MAVRLGSMMRGVARIINYESSSAIVLHIITMAIVKCCGRGVIDVSLYNRYISYLYLYSNGLKNKNVGFAKTERRNGQVKLWINLKGAYLDSEETCAHFFIRENGKIYGINVGSLRTKLGICECKFVMEEDNLPICFEEICGIYISGENGNQIIASQWDDLGFDAAAVSLYQRPLSEEEQTGEVQTEVANTDEEQTEVANTGEMQLADELPIWQRPIREEIYVNASEIQEPSEEYPMIFCDDEITQCKDIALADLKDCEGANELANNSFVSHGFYYYHHLLYGKKDDSTYIIGVPGVYNRREKMTAIMFGFTNFKFSMRSDVHISHFGYWYKEFRC